MATTSNRIGTTRKRLAHLICELLPTIEVLPADLHSNSRFYDKIDLMDACKWWGTAQKHGTTMPVELYSWDTMTDCVRYGITIEADDPFTYEIIAFRPVVLPPPLQDY